MSTIAEADNIPGFRRRNELRERLSRLKTNALTISCKYSSLVRKTWDTRFSSKEDFELQKIDIKSGGSGFIKSIGKDIVALVGSMVCSINRSMNLRELNDLKKKAEQLFDENRILFQDANALIEQDGLEAIYFYNPLRSSDFKLKNSLSNKNWGEEFDQLGRELQKALDDFSLVANRLYEQVGIEDLSPLLSLPNLERLYFDIANIKNPPVHRDAEGRLHNDKGAVISLPSGWGPYGWFFGSKDEDRLYYWHGVEIPSEWVTGKPPSAKEALTWENIEQRRAACEIVGWKNILRELDVTVIDEDGDPEIGILLEADIPDSMSERFLQVRCGTGRDFVLPVPPHVSTALEANAWTWGLEGYEYKPEIRT